MSKFVKKLIFSSDITDQHVCRVHPETLREFENEILDGDYILLKGRLRYETILHVTSDPEIKVGYLAVGYRVFANLDMKTNFPSVIVYPCHDIKYGERVIIQPVYKAIDSKVVLDYFTGTKPVCRGNIIKIGDMGFVKVVSCVPAVYCLVGKNTNIEVVSNVDSVGNQTELVGYDNIGGCSRQLEQIREMIDLPLRHPEIFHSVGIHPPRGILLYGPPGTGKTMIARAIANETGAFFFFINGPEVMSKMAGESEANIRKIFKEAERNSPAIIFIDEIDSMAPRRDKSTGDVDKRIVSQLLTMMDGLKERATVIVVGATNRPNALDPALRRYGRFDREINIGVPDLKGRMEILKIHTSNLKIDPAVNLTKIAERTHGYVGADIANVCSEAAMQCIREHGRGIDFDKGGKITDRDLKKIVVKPEHFEKALIGSKPASLREAMVEIPTVTWNDVGGLEDVKSKLKEMVEAPIKNGALFADFGLKPPRGVLFYGPPGCGKTLIAKAVASQCGVNFLSVKGSELVTKWLGESEANVRELFESARQASPCILFFDEMDSIAKVRGGGGFGGGDSAMDRIINQLLTEMDGISSTKQVFVIGATNRPEIIDPAIIRPGRLDRLIYIPLPDKSSRVAVFEASLKNIPVDYKSCNIDFLADITDGYSGADINEICQLASRTAMNDYMRAIIKEKMVYGYHLENSVYETRRSVKQEDIQRYEMFIKRSGL